MDSDSANVFLDIQRSPEEMRALIERLCREAVERGYREGFARGFETGVELWVRAKSPEKHA